MQKIRESNFELMRLLLMLMIVGLHVFARGGSLATDNPLNIGDSNFLPAYFMETLFIIAVNCFVLLSGYFLINLTFRRLFSFYFQIFTYSVVISLCFFVYDVIRENPMDKIDTVKSFIPFLSRRWWFATDYLVLFLAAPLLNIIIKNLATTQFKVTILVMFGLFVIAPTLGFQLTISSFLSFVHLIFIYFVGAYLRQTDIKIKQSSNLLFYIGISVIIVGIIWFLAYKFNYNQGYQNHFLRYNNILVFFSSIFFFQFFRHLKLGYVPWINKLSPLAFGIYLFHEHPRIFPVIYKDLFHCEQYYYSSLFIPNVLFTMVCIFFMGLFVEFIRQKLFKSLEQKIATRILTSSLTKKIQKIIER